MVGNRVSDNPAYCMGHFRQHSGLVAVAADVAVAAAADAAAGAVVVAVVAAGIESLTQPITPQRLSELVAAGSAVVGAAILSCVGPGSGARGSGALRKFGRFGIGVVECY